MAAVDQAKAVLEGLAGKTLDQAQMINIVENVIRYRDVQDLTGEEKAQTFIDALLLLVKRRAKAGASTKAHEDNAAIVQAAVDASIVDL